MMHNDTFPKVTWISASAGTGKTKSLIDHIIKLLIVNETGIVCVTFTNAVISEIRNRIYYEASQWLTLSDDALIEYAEKITSTSTQNKIIQNTIIDRMRNTLFTLTKQPNVLQIHTIHSLCTNIITKFYKECELSQYVNIIDDNIQKQL